MMMRWYPLPNSVTVAMKECQDFSEEINHYSVLNIPTANATFATLTRNNDKMIQPLQPLAGILLFAFFCYVIDIVGGLQLVATIHFEKPLSIRQFS